MTMPTIVSLSYFNYAVSACVGGLFVLVTVFLPQGLAGLPAQLRAWLRRQRHSAPSEAATQGGAA